MIKGIQLEIDGKTINIPIDKAKELYKDLKELFEKKTNVGYTPNPFIPEPINPFKIGQPFDIAKGPLDIRYTVKDTTGNIKYPL